jgi:hypothetical protein
MEHFLRGREFEDIDQVEAVCQEFFNLKEPIFYRLRIELLGQRWLDVVDNNGEYLVYMLFNFLSNKYLFIFLKNAQNFLDPLI